MTKRGVIVQFSLEAAAEMKTHPAEIVKQMVERVLPQGRFVIKHWTDPGSDKLNVKVCVDDIAVDAAFLPEVGEAQPYPLVALPDLKRWTESKERPW